MRDKEEQFVSSIIEHMSMKKLRVVAHLMLIADELETKIQFQYLYIILNDN